MHDTPPPGDRKPNHLEGQTSPYLLQHVYNPVDWYPWGDEALERARREQRPIFLSIGYASCHWCHVMERESFEDPRIAELLNRLFVPIKVDREERPDIDDIYMNAIQLMTGQGGWPLNVFLTPQLKPFMGGTYFPPEDRHGRIGFPAVLERIGQAWNETRTEIDSSAERLTQELQRLTLAPADPGAPRPVGEREISRAAAGLAQRYDSRWGGFGAAPKFPPDGALGLLLREHARTGQEVPLEMAAKTLDGMALGGMYDHVGGGFSRYSVDDRWLVPHFEKMLYNQALLVPCYVDGWLVTGKPLYRRVVLETLDFVRRELTDPAGGLYSSLDADSEGDEGKFYVWTADEIETQLGCEDGRLFCETYGVSVTGNFEGRNIPNRLEGEIDETLERRVAPLRQKLLDARARRVRPATDDKILTAWNGLTISACCRAYQAFGRETDLAMARAAADFILRELYRDERLLVSYRRGQAQLNAYLDEHAFFARGLLDLYETAFELRYLEHAERLARTMIERFEDRDNGGFFFTSDDHEALLTRNRSLHDGALPAGASVAAEVLLRLAVHRRNEDLERAARRTLESYRPRVERMPSAFASLLLAAELAWRPPQEIAIVGPPTDPRTSELLSVVRSHFRVCPVIQLSSSPVDDAGLALLAGKKPIGDKPTAWVCRDYTCGKPTTDPAELARQLGDT